MNTVGVGATLRQERLRQGLSLEEIARQTRIAQRFLDAIEAGRFEALPGIVFCRNFVRQYAEVLKLDPSPLVASLPTVDVEAAPLPNPASYPPRTSKSAAWLPSVSSVLWIVLVSGVSAAAWFHFREPRSQAPRLPAPNSASLQAQSPKPESPVPVQTVAAPVPLTPEMAGRPVQVVLTAKEASWVQIVADGKNLFTGMLNPHDSRAIAADAIIKVTAGNAGGLEISLNGKALDPLGPSGQVRTVRLTAEGSELVSRTPAATTL